MMVYNNYHKHDHVSNLFTPDTNSHIEHYAKRAVELGHRNIFTTNHGSGGDIFESVSVATKYGLGCKFGIEAYIVVDPLEKDSRNYHICLIPIANKARKKLNKITSKSNITGFYYKPRISPQDLIESFEKDELYLTTACLGGILKDDDSFNKIFLPLVSKFGDNMLLEVQSHMDNDQINLNNKILKLSKMYNLKIIAANDSHYIYPEQSKERNELLKGKGINYTNENEFILDYPSYEVFFERFMLQGVLNRDEIYAALNNTLIFDGCEDIYIDKSVKMPTIYKELSSDEKINKLKKIIDMNIDTHIDFTRSKSSREEYVQEIEKEFSVIRDTNEVSSADYFLFNYAMLDLAINKYNGVLTRSGRGSGGAFLINKVLGITEIDRLNINLPIYSERFMSTERLLENKAMPDIDFNVVSQEPFVRATKDLLGELGCYPMIAYGTMQMGESFRNICRSAEIPYDEFNDVAKNIENYTNHKKWGLMIAEANKYVDTIISSSVHPCAYVLYNGDIEEEIGVVRCKEHICALITSDEADEYKYLKNDYLIVSVWDLISSTFELIGKPIITVSELLENLDDKIWSLFAKGMTCTLNQVDGSWATQLVKQYKPTSLEELSMFIACIRPSFDAQRDIFINRNGYSTGSSSLDKVFELTNHFILFQEDIMKYFEWLGVSPSTSIGLIKKISKKKIKPEDFAKLEEGLRNEWIKKTGSISMFKETWADIQSSLNYGFNSPHGAATAIDSLYCAYLKHNYPLEYYLVCLNKYADSEDKTDRLLKEMSYFKIKLSKAKFGYSRAEYFVDKSTRTIYKGMKSIKFVSKNVSDNLYKLSQNNKYTNFLDLLTDMYEQCEVNTRVVDILIKLDFFVDFGEIGYLLRCHERFEEFKRGKLKNQAIEKITDENLHKIFAKHSKITTKTYKVENCDSLLREVLLYDRLSNSYNISYQQMADWHLEFLGYIDLATGNKSDIYKLYVTDVTPLMTKDKSKTWAYKVKTYNMCTGKNSEVLVNSGIYKKMPIEKTNILETNPKGFKLEERGGYKNCFLLSYNIIYKEK